MKAHKTSAKEARCGVERSNYIKSLLFSDTRLRVFNKLIQLERYSGGLLVLQVHKTS